MASQQSFTEVLRLVLEGSDDVARQMAQVGRSAQETQRSMAHTQASTDALARSFGSFDQTLGRWQHDANNMLQAVEDLSRAYDQSGRAVGTFERAVNGSTRSTQQVQQGMVAAGEATLQLGGALEGVRGPASVAEGALGRVQSVVGGLASGLKGAAGAIGGTLGGIGDAVGGILGAPAAIMGGLTRFGFAIQGVTALQGMVSAAGQLVGIGAAQEIKNLEAAMRGMSTTQGISMEALNEQVAGIEALNIDAATARGAVVRLTQSQLDLSKATDLVAVAQNASVISGKQTNDVLESLVHGITTQNSLVLRNAGITIDANAAQAAYAKSLGVSTKQLTANQKQQAVMNAVLAEGEKIAGIAAEAQDPIAAMPQAIRQLSLAFGRELLPAITPLAEELFKFVQNLSKSGQIKTIAHGIAQGLGAVVNVIRAFGQALGALWSIIEGPVGRALGWLRDMISALWQALTSDAGALGVVYDLLRQAFGEDTADLLQPLLQAVMDFFRGIEKGGGWLEWLGEIWNGTLAPALRGVWSFIRAYLLPVLAQLTHFIFARVVPAAIQFAQWFAQRILPALREVAYWVVTKVIPAIQRLAEWVGENVMPRLEEFGRWLSTDGVKALEAFFGWLDQVGGVLEAIGGWLGVRVVPQLQKMVGWLERFMKAFMAGGWEQEWKTMQETFGVIGEIAIEVGKILGELWKGIFGGEEAMEGAAGEGDQLADSFDSATWAGTAFRREIKQMTLDIKALFQAIKDVLEQLTKLLEFLNRYKFTLHGGGPGGVLPRFWDTQAENFAEEWRAYQQEWRTNPETGQGYAPFEAQPGRIQSGAAPGSLWEQWTRGDQTAWSPDHPLTTTDPWKSLQAGEPKQVFNERMRALGKDWDSMRVFDSGGWLPSGHAALNLSGQPEYVLPPGSPLPPVATGGEGTGGTTIQVSLGGVVIQSRATATPGFVDEVARLLAPALERELNNIPLGGGMLG